MKSKVRAGIVLLAIFVLGAATGVAGTYAMTRQRDAGLYSSESLEDHDHLRLRAMARRLDLDEGQTAEVRAILDRYREQRRALRDQLQESCLKPVAELRSQMEDEIATVLNADQRQQFERIKDRRQGRRHGPRRHKQRFRNPADAPPR